MAKGPYINRPQQVTKRSRRGTELATAGASSRAQAERQSQRQAEIAEIEKNAVNAGDRRPSMPKPMANYPRPGKTDRRGKGGM